jgi:hypothetical protein
MRNRTAALRHWTSALRSSPLFFRSSFFGGLLFFRMVINPFV